MPAKKLKANNKLQNPKTFHWIYYPEKATENKRNTAMEFFTCNYVTSKTKFSCLCCWKFID